MTYTKPTIAELGSASELIKGGKPAIGDAGSLQQPGNSDCELDD